MPIARISLLIIALYVCYQLLSPIVVRFIYGEQFKQLMFECDNSMRDHYIAKKQLELQPSEQALKNLQSAELGLLECHEYDKLRKKLISLGLNSNDLSLLGIEALEEKNYDLDKFVEIHEFRY